jgi:hypothetical protein
LRAFLQAEAARTPGADRAPLIQLCRVVFNLNEFVYPD